MKTARVSFFLNFKCEHRDPRPQIGRTRTERFGPSTGPGPGKKKSRTGPGPEKIQILGLLRTERSSNQAVRGTL